MPRSIWTINNAGGDPDGSDLIGCHIKETSTGYDFTSPNGTKLASTTSATPPFTFPNFPYEGWTWTIEVTTLAASGVSGGWSNNNPTITGEEGTWSTGAGDDQEEDAAAAAT